MWDSARCDAEGLTVAVAAQLQVSCGETVKHDACVAPTALGVYFFAFSRRFRTGLTYAAPLALMRGDVALTRRFERGAAYNAARNEERSLAALGMTASLFLTINTWGSDVVDAFDVEDAWDTFYGA